MMLRPLYAALSERMSVLACRVLLDDRGCPTLGQEGTERIAVIGGIGQQGADPRQRLDQAFGRTAVVAVSSGQFEGDEPAVTINDGVDFGGAPTSALADGLSIGPSFPPVAQRWAFAVVLSMHWMSAASYAMSWLRIAAQMPAFDQRLKRL